MSGEPSADEVVAELDLDPVDVDDEIRWLEARAAAETRPAAGATMIGLYERAADVASEPVEAAFRAGALTVATMGASTLDGQLVGDLRAVGVDHPDADEYLVGGIAASFADDTARERFHRLNEFFRATGLDVDSDVDLDRALSGLQTRAVQKSSRLRVAGVLKGLRGFRERDDADPVDRVLAERTARALVDRERDRTDPTPGDEDVSHNTVLGFAVAATPEGRDATGPTWPSVVGGAIDNYEWSLAELVDLAGVPWVKTRRDVMLAEQAIEDGSEDRDPDGRSATR